MNPDTNHRLLQVIQDAMKRHYVFFDVVDAFTLRLDSTIDMYPVIKIIDDGVVFTCPLAYYETEEQQQGLLKMFESSRQIWYDEAGLGPFMGECNEPSTRVETLPEGLVFKVNQTRRLISAFLTFKPDFILSNPNEFSSALKTVCWYPNASKRQISQVIYKSMSKTVTDSADPKSFFYCTMLLNYRNQGNSETVPWIAVDWQDVRTTIKKSNQLIFYPSLLSDSFEGLVTKMERVFIKDLAINEPYGIIMVLTLPQKCLSDYHNGPFRIWNLRNQFGSDFVKTHIIVADDSRLYSAEMALLKLKNKRF